MTAAPSNRPTLESGDRVLVTGAAGFIGSSVARELSARGARVVAPCSPRVPTVEV